jgi:hypothetical protein
MGQHATVLATYHELQGLDGRTSSVDDPVYAILMRTLVERQGIDFIFEEASGANPSTAERFAEEIFGEGHYLDVDPPLQKRVDLGIPSEVSTPELFGNPPTAGFAYWQSTNGHDAREKLWFRLIQAQRFNRALVICGIAHGLSFAFRLKSAEFDVKVINYVPELSTFRR